MRVPAPAAEDALAAEPALEKGTGEALPRLVEPGERVKQVTPHARALAAALSAALLSRKARAWIQTEDCSAFTNSPPQLKHNGNPNGDAVLSIRSKALAVYQAAWSVMLPVSHQVPTVLDVKPTTETYGRAGSRTLKRSPFRR